jgi:hypothetical protein
MNLLKEVIRDLAHFAYTALCGRRIAATHSDSILLPSFTMPDLLTGKVRQATRMHAEYGVPHTLHEKALDDVFQIPLIPPERNSIIYTATSDAPLRAFPDSATDSIIARIPYGAMLVALLSKDRWVRVFHRGTEGWVSFDDIVDRAAYVYPKFTIGERNESSDPNTERVRAMIRDEFSYGEHDVSLQAEEYVLYRLTRAGISVPWSSVRPRTPGHWAHSLDVSYGVQINEAPSARSVIEWVFEDGRGHIAFVESVTNDSEIKISEANWPEGGIYNERVLVAEEWYRLNPRFITFA